MNAAATPRSRSARWPLLHFLRHLLAQFQADQCTRAAAALAYTTLLALVPFFTVTFLTVSALPAFQGWREAIEGFVFHNFVPAAGEQVQGYLTQFSTNARGLQAAGFAVLVVTVVALLGTIESTFNVIWGVRRRRPLMLRLLVYWALLTLGPILIGAGLVATSYVMASPVIERASFARGVWLVLAPPLATSAGFFLFFKLIPYRPVPTRHALIGGAVAGLLFELAKRAFALFVLRFPAQQAIYGAFATVPILLSWVYLSWVIVLFGAELTHGLGTYRGERPHRHGLFGSDEAFYVAFRVLLRLHEAQGQGHRLTEKALRRLEPDFDAAVIDIALETLDAAGWVSRDEDFEWMLARDLDRLRLVDLLRLVPCVPGGIEASVDGKLDEADARLLPELRALEGWSTTHLSTPLADLMPLPGTPTLPA